MAAQLCHPTQPLPVSLLFLIIAPGLNPDKPRPEQGQNCLIPEAGRNPSQDPEALHLIVQGGHICVPAKRYVEPNGCWKVTCYISYPHPTPLPTSTPSWAVYSIGRIYLFILSLFGLFSSCSKQGYPLVTVLRLLFAGASFAAECGLQGGGLWRLQHVSSAVAGLPGSGAQAQ